MTVAGGLTASGSTPLAAVTENVKEPGAVGVPDRTPVRGSRLTPGGREPVGAYVGGGVPEAR